MNTPRPLLMALTGLATTALLPSCTGSAPAAAPDVDTVTVAQVRLADTTTFKKSNGEVCTIYADATFSYPTACADTTALSRLRQLYATVVLGAPDSVELAEAMRLCVGNSMHQYDMTAPGEAADEADGGEADPALAYHTSSTVLTHYNRRGLVTFCRVDVVRKDSVVTGVTHRYYTIDLHRMAAVELKDLFRDDALPEVAALLRSRLLEQNKASGSEQLTELGYYNVDNLAVTDNFYFDRDGVTWSYLPNELAVAAVGEPGVTLPYDVLTPLACEGSLLARMR